MPSCTPPPPHTHTPWNSPQAVLVHQLSRGATQNPFRKNRGRVVRVLFHPTKSFFFVATQQNVSDGGGGGWGGARRRRRRAQAVGGGQGFRGCKAAAERGKTTHQACAPLPACRSPLQFTHTPAVSAPRLQVRVYNLAKQALAKKLVAGSGVITSMAVHPTGDHLIVGAEDKRLWCVQGRGRVFGCGWMHGWLRGGAKQGQHPSGGVGGDGQMCAVHCVGACVGVWASSHAWVCMCALASQDDET